MVHPAMIHSNVLSSRLFATIFKILVTHKPITFVEKNKKDTIHQNGGILNCAWLDSKCYAKYSKWPHFSRHCWNILFYWIL